MDPDRYERIDDSDEKKKMDHLAIEINQKMDDGQLKLESEMSDLDQLQITDIVCEMCHSGENEETLLLCDWCDRGWHIECIGLASLPVDEWLCTSCSPESPENETLNDREERRFDEGYEAYLSKMKTY